ncbi:hypothetical protein IG631_16023 [Alternaria alternata]|nr:hypothetical protein IG631_16023 [Alternaria alternata]
MPGHFLNAVRAEARFEFQVPHEKGQLRMCLGREFRAVCRPSTSFEDSRCWLLIAAAVA